MKKLDLTVDAEFDGWRLDNFISRHNDIPSRSFAQKLISNGYVTINGCGASKSGHIRSGDLVEITIPDPKPLDLRPQSIPIKIIYEDEDLIVVSKSAGMVVHPSAGHDSGTLVHAMLAHAKDLSGIGGIERPGIVHRLDKDTSGLMLVAKNDRSHVALAKQISLKTCTRIYSALVIGNIKEDRGIIDAPLGRSLMDRKKISVRTDGRSAITDFDVIERFVDYTLLDVRLTTGRTHQIRAHMAYIKHPIVGDPQYGGRRQGLSLELHRQFLHAKELSFTSPSSGKRLRFTDGLPQDLARVLDMLRQRRD